MFTPLEHNRHSKNPETVSCHQKWYKNKLTEGIREKNPKQTGIGNAFGEGKR